MRRSWIPLVCLISFLRTFLIGIDDQDQQIDSGIHFSPREILTSRSHMPDIYDKALRELERLEEKPLCHRLAAQLSMSSCKKLEDNGQGVDRQGNAHIHSHSLESFTIALAMCDLELGEFVIPDACTSFTSSALIQTSRDGGDSLQVSSGQKDACLKALSQDHSHWYTLLSNRGTALLFCQAARIDIEKGMLYLLFLMVSSNTSQMNISSSTKSWHIS